MTKLIPCPVSGTFPCFDCLFDNDIYCEGPRNILVGCLNGGFATTRFSEASNVVTIRFLDRPANELDVERIEGWLDVVRGDVNKNLSSNSTKMMTKMMTKSKKMMTNISFHNNRHVCKVLFTYLVEE